MHIKSVRVSILSLLEKLPETLKGGLVDEQTPRRERVVGRKNKLTKTLRPESSVKLENMLLPWLIA